MPNESLSDAETDGRSGKWIPGDIECHGKSQEDGINEYEKQRLLRIRENRAKMEAFGLHKLTSSVLSPAANRQKGIEKLKKKGKGKISEKDDEYRPPDGEDGENSTSEEDEEKDGTVGSRKGLNRKGKKRSPVKTIRTKKNLPIRGDMRETDLLDDDAALQQAIALSLGGPLENSGTNMGNVGLTKRKESTHIPEATGRRKRGKSNINRVQMSEDEVIVYFFSIDESGKGKITLRDLKKVAKAHDFDWTDNELADMIECFDKGGDSQLSLDDFQTIVARCNMIRAAENA